MELDDAVPPVTRRIPVDGQPHIPGITRRHGIGLQLGGLTAGLGTGQHRRPRRTINRSPNRERTLPLIAPVPGNQHPTNGLRRPKIEHDRLRLTLRRPPRRRRQITINRTLGPIPIIRPIIGSPNRNHRPSRTSTAIGEHRDRNDHPNSRRQDSDTHDADRCQSRNRKTQSGTMYFFSQAITRHLYATLSLSAAASHRDR